MWARRRALHRRLGWACGALALGAIACRAPCAELAARPRGGGSAIAAPSAGPRAPTRSDLPPSAPVASHEAVDTGSPSQPRGPRRARWPLGWRPLVAGYREWSCSFADAPFGVASALVVAPEVLDDELPVLVALHGRGEALKGNARGVRGWVDDYGLGHALLRLSSPPLTPDDFGGQVRADRLREINASLRARPFRGYLVVMPYLADRLRAERLFVEAPAYAAFLDERLLPTVEEAFGLVPSPSTTGVDGVSLGGRAALMAGFLEPARFGHVGGLQPAFDGKELERVVALARAARRSRPGQSLRLLTSVDDYYRPEVRKLSRGLHAAGLSHRLDEVLGNHSYEFNRGPGVYELLLYYDRVLRGEPFLKGSSRIDPP